MLDAFGMSLDDWRKWAVDQKLPAFRGQQIMDGLYKGAKCFSSIRGLPKERATTLDAKHQIIPAQVYKEQESSDGTVKTLLQLHDGHLVECVSIPTSDRHTICVSSQVGCAVGCTFCASGLNGVKRDCQPGEIVYQILYHHFRRPVTNVVFMGSGEPLFNYDNVLKTISVLADERGLGMGRRRLTVSTSGVPNRIRQFANDEPQVTLALSLHAPDDETRSKIVPLNRRWPLTVLLGAMDEYAQKVNRRMTLEYVLLADSNMRDDQAKQLADIALRYGAHINLIPFNPVEQTPHKRPSWDAIDHFADEVTKHGGRVTVRGQRGADIDAACGQLVLKNSNKN